MFGLFKPQRQRLKEEGERMFNNYLPALEGMAPDEIGFVLDFAVRIKHSTSLYGTGREELLLFEDPVMLSEKYAFETLRLWKQTMKAEAGSTQGMAKIAALSIWYLSVLSVHISELRIRGRDLWGQLERGFDYCQEFDPENDIVKGLEPMK